MLTTMGGRKDIPSRRHSEEVINSTYNSSNNRNSMSMSNISSGGAGAGAGAGAATTEAATTRKSLQSDESLYESLLKHHRESMRFDTTTTPSSNNNTPIKPRGDNNNNKESASEHEHTYEHKDQAEAEVEHKDQHGHEHEHLEGTNNGNAQTTKIRSNFSDRTSFRTYSRPGLSSSVSSSSPSQFSTSPLARRRESTGTKKGLGENQQRRQQQFYTEKMAYTTMEKNDSDRKLPAATTLASVASSGGRQQSPGTRSRVLPSSVSRKNPPLHRSISQPTTTAAENIDDNDDNCMENNSKSMSHIKQASAVTRSKSSKIEFTPTSSIHFKSFKKMGVAAEAERPSNERQSSFYKAALAAAGVEKTENTDEDEKLARLLAEELERKAMSAAKEDEELARKLMEEQEQEQNTTDVSEDYQKIERDAAMALRLMQQLSFPANDVSQDEILARELSMVELPQNGPQASPVPDQIQILEKIKLERERRELEMALKASSGGVATAEINPLSALNALTTTNPNTSTGNADFLLSQEIAMREWTEYQQNSQHMSPMDHHQHAMQHAINANPMHNSLMNTNPMQNPMNSPMNGMNNQIGRMGGMSMHQQQLPNRPGGPIHMANARYGTIPGGGQMGAGGILTNGQGGNVPVTGDPQATSSWSSSQPRHPFVHQSYSPPRQHPLEQSINNNSNNNTRRLPNSSNLPSTIPSNVIPASIPSMGAGIPTVEGTLIDPQTLRGIESSPPSTNNAGPGTLRTQRSVQFSDANTQPGRTTRNSIGGGRPDPIRPNMMGLPQHQQQLSPNDRNMNSDILRRGNEETRSAMEANQSHVVQCQGCNGRLHAPMSYALVFCPNCNTVSPGLAADRGNNGGR